MLVLLHRLNEEARDSLRYALWQAGYAVRDARLAAGDQEGHLVVYDEQAGPPDTDRPLLRHDGYVERTVGAVKWMLPPLSHLSLSGAELDLVAGVGRGVRGAFRLSELEVRLLRFFASHRGEVLDQQVLLERVWGYRPGTRSRTVVSTLHRLRRKVEENPSAPRHLRSVYGRGYRFELTSEALGSVCAACAMRREFVSGGRGYRRDKLPLPA